ncbi:ATP-binding protein [Streptomyces sp. NPDC001941]|uniref:sensor histidine kinase n=1 Tax=Streptomyces sp. NPDC001941 TaxID=3154659 RepID=UPI003318E8D6
MLDRLPTGPRTALLSGLVALLVCTGGAWWLRQHLYDDQISAATDKARVQARAVARALVLGKQTALIEGQLSWPYVVVTEDGNGIGSSDGFTIPHGQVPPAPASAPAGWTTTRTVTTAGPKRQPIEDTADPDSPSTRKPGPPDTHDRPRTPPTTGRSAHPDAPASPPAPSPLAHRTFTAVGALIDIKPGEPTVFGEHGGRYTVYVLVLPDAADQAVAALDPALLAGVPLAALLVAVTAHLATRRALKPVEAIRAELAEISAHHLGRRVPVPRARDAIQDLATTTNRTLDQLEHSHTQQERFVADAAHELRSPVTGLRTLLEVCLTYPDRTDWPRTAGHTLDTTRRLQALIDDLLLLSRPQATATPALTDLAGTARELIDQQRAVIRPHVTLHLDAPPTAPVRGNPLQLHRLLRNLLDNAARHARTRITVTVTSDPDATTVEVHNDGPDLPAHRREYVFERFARLDDARDRDSGGSGLGLAIARDIARRHHGTLTVGDTPPGSGTAFVLVLPTAHTTTR